MGRRLRAVPLAAAVLASACSSSTQPGEPVTADLVEPIATAVPTGEAEVGPTPQPTVDAGPTTVEDAPCASVPTGATDTSLTALGNRYEVRIYVPSSFDGQTPIPVVLDWHGLGSNGIQQRLLSGYEDVAETEGFMVVHPTGLAEEGGPASWQLLDAPDSARDDLAFADTLIDELMANWCADPARVYSTGMSNGGFFTARLICERADRLAAAVSVAGTYHPPDCAPTRPVPYIAFHGTADIVVPFAGGESILLEEDADPAAIAFFDQAMPAEFAEFAEGAGCGVDPTVTDVSDEVIRYDYNGCTDDVPMTFFEVTNGGHTWPNSPVAAVIGDALGYFTLDVDATVDGWAFMAEHSLG